MQAAIHEFHDAVCPCRGRPRMGHQDARCAAGAELLEEQVEHLHRTPGVEVAGRLVGKHHRRLVHQRTCDRHALQLATRQQVGRVVCSPPKPHAAEHLARTPVGLSLRLLQQPQGQGHVLRQAQMRQDVEGLENEAEVPAAQACEAVVIEPRKFRPGHPDLAAIERLKASDAVEQGGFAHARLADDGDTFAAGDLQFERIEEHAWWRTGKGLYQSG